MFRGKGLVMGGLPSEMNTMFGHFNAGLKLYREKKWDEAFGQFSLALKAAPGDGPSRVYVQRCKGYMVNPPPEDWDGVYIDTTK